MTLETANWKEVADKAISLGEAIARATGREWAISTADAIRAVFDRLFGQPRLYGASLVETTAQADTVEVDLYAAAADPANALPVWLVPVLLQLIELWRRSRS
jgi:hypothetical protein